MQKYVHIHSQQCVKVKRRRGGCSRDCDKWLSMTLTVEERFSSAWRGERGRPKERERKQPEASVASVASTLYWLREGHFKTQNTFLVSLNGIEAKGSHCSLPALEILQ